MTVRGVLLIVGACLTGLAGARAGDSAGAAPRNEIVFVSDWAENLGAAELYSVDVSSGRRRRLTSSAFRTEDTPAVSPDGTRIAFVRTAANETGRSEILVANRDGRKRIIVARDVSIAWRDQTYGRAELAWAPNSRSVAFVTNSPSELRVAAADGTGADVLAKAGGDSSPSWAPSGDRIAFETRDGLATIDADGGHLTQLGVPGEDPAWSPDGTTIAFVPPEYDGEGMFLVAANGGEARRIVSGPAVRPTWSPNGRALAFVRGSVENGRVSVVNRDGSGERPLAALPSFAPSWSPTGRQIAFVVRHAQGEVELTDLETDTIRVIDVSTRSGRNLPAVPLEIVRPPTWTRDGRRLLYAAQTPLNDPELYVMNVDGSHLRALTKNLVAEREPAWSPDHKRIAFVRDVWRSEDPYTNLCRFCHPPWIYVMTSAGTNVRRLVRGLHPAWSPDGTRIAYDDGYDIFTIPADGGRRQLVARNGDWRSEEPTWSPDGRQIAFDRAGRIAIAPSTGGPARYLTPPDKGDELGSDWVPSWSPKASQIAFGRRESICILTIKSRRVRCLPRMNSRSPDWSPDGSRLIFEWYAGEHSVVVVSTSEGRVRLLRDKTAGSAFQPDW